MKVKTAGGTQKELLEVGSLGLGTYPADSLNCLDIDLLGKKNGMIEKISTEDGSKIKNCPYNLTGAVIFIKVQYVVSKGHAIVILYNIYPNTGAMWINIFNNAWKGWKLIAGEIVGWTGKVTNGASITVPCINMGSTYEIVTDQSDICIGNMSKTTNDIACFGATYNAGDETSLTTGHLLVNGSVVTVADFKRKQFSSSSMSVLRPVYITKIIIKP